MATGKPTKAEAEALLMETKVITVNLAWRPEGRRYKLEATVLATESETLLRLYANVGIRNRSVALGA